jgi:hypothetical protein
MQPHFSQTIMSAPKMDFTLAAPNGDLGSVQKDHRREPLVAKTEDNGGSMLVCGDIP